MNLRRLFIFLACPALFYNPSQSNADVIIDNTLNGTATLSLPGENSDLTTNRGYAFTVGNTGFSLAQITFGIYGNTQGTGNVGVRLYQGLGATGSPVQDTGTSVLNLNLINSALYYDFNVSWTLNANTTYSLMAYGSSNAIQPRLAVTSQPLVVDPLVTGVGFYNNTATVTKNYAVRFQSPAVPEPSTFMMALVGLACGGYPIWRRRKRTKR